MSMQKTPEPAHDAVNETVVLQYLRRHPDFFIKHTDILTEIKLPHHASGAVSLIERQVDILRNKTREQQHQLHALIQVARDNDRLNEHMQRLTLALMECHSLDRIFSVLHRNLSHDFRAEVMAMRLFADPKQLPEERYLESVDVTCAPRNSDCTEEAFGAMLENGKPLCGRLRPVQLEYLFGLQADTVASAVALPLICTNGAQGPRPSLGILGIGSHDPHRFHPGMGTLFLTHMGELIGCALRPHLNMT